MAEEDLYEFDASIDQDEMENDADFQEALKTSTGKRPTVCIPYFIFHICFTNRSQWLYISNK